MHQACTLPVQLLTAMQSGRGTTERDALFRSTAFSWEV